MRRLYLFRHARPDIPFTSHLCIGATDLPLGTLGHIQACVTAYAVRAIEFSAVFCSELSRSRESAEYLSKLPIALPGLEEMYCGEWEGLDFSEIRRRWPELYEARGLDFSIAIPGAEDNNAGQARFIKALRHALDMTQGDIAVVAHSTCNQSLLCYINGLSAYEGRSFKLPYGSLCTFLYDGEFHLESIDKQLCPRLNSELCLAMLNAAGLPSNIIRHCQAVAEMTYELCDALIAVGISLDRERAYEAAYLHDIARLESSHAELGARWLSELGYPSHSNIVRQHHDLDCIRLDEAAVVYMADKLIDGDRRISLSERFLKSADRCTTAQARASHERRLRQAAELGSLINSTVNKEIVK